MFEAICYGIISLIGGGFAEMFVEGWGAVVSISVIGFGIIETLKKNQ